MALANYSKAIAAFIAAAAAGIGAAILLGSPGDATITQSEWIAIATTALVATAGVFFAPANRPAETPAEPVEG